MTTDVLATLEERGGRYGPFIDHATIAQGIQTVLFAAPNWSKLDPDMRQALCVISDKMARILNGDPYYDDNWHDIQGYARLVEDRIHAMEKRNEAEKTIQEMIEQAQEANADGLTPVNYSENNLAEYNPPIGYCYNDKSTDPNYDVGNYRG